MERQQAAGQEKKLMEVMVEMESLNVVAEPGGSPADRRGCLKCAAALATVLGLVVAALVVGFALHHFMFGESCRQDAPPLTDAPPLKVNITCKLRKRKHLEYDIFTVKKAAEYLIYGWVMLSNVTGEDISLVQKLSETNRTIERKNAITTEIFFFNKVLLANNISLSIIFNSNGDPKDSLFHIYEL